MELLRFYAEEYVRLIKDLHDLYVSFCMEVHKDTAEPDHTEFVKDAKEVFARAAMSCAKIGLQVSAKHANELLTFRVSSLSASDIEALRDNIQRELSCHFYVGISPERKEAFTSSRIGWEEVCRDFPDAIEDIEEMQKCFALCRYSAAVFHSLLVVEHGLVRLGKKIGVTDPKEGWDASTRKLAAIVVAGREKNETGLSFEYLEQLNASVHVMKFAWRNKVNHATGKPLVMGGGFAPYVAEEIITATRNFMRQLGDGLRERRGDSEQNCPVQQPERSQV